MLNSIFGKRKDKSGSSENISAPTETVPAVDITAHYHEFDAAHYQNLIADAASATDRAFSSSFWPPVRCGKFKTTMAPVDLKCLEFVVEDADLLNFVKASEVYRSLCHLGVEAKLIKASGKDNSVHVAICTAICSVANSYDIQVGNGRVVVIGADKTGILYGLYTLLQFLRLHAELKIDAASGSSLVIPAAVLSDRADVPNRAVLWSFRQQVRASTHRMHEQIELLSRLRMNSIFLVIDEPVGNAADTAALSEFLKFAEAHQVAVTPTVLVSSIHQGLESFESFSVALYCCAFNLLSFGLCVVVFCRVPSATLGLFPRTSLSLIFILTYQSIADELYATHDKSVDSSAVLQAHTEVSNRILGDVKAAGFTDVLVSIADQKNLQQNPMVCFALWNVSKRHISPVIDS